MKKNLIEINGETFKTSALRRGHELWMHVNGETWVIDLRPKTTKKEGAAARDENEETILSPMPGKILKINFSRGDKIKVQQVVIVMEAMKMEYSLTASIDGVLKKIEAKVGQQVELNQILAKIEKV